MNTQEMSDLDLIKAIQTHVKKYKEPASKELIQRHEHFVYQQVKKMLPMFRNNGVVDIDDALQAGKMGLLEAAERFDLMATNKFLSYAAFYVNNEIYNSITCAGFALGLNQMGMEWKIQSAVESGLSSDEICSTLHITEDTLNRYWANMQLSFLDAPINNDNDCTTLDLIASPERFEDASCDRVMQQEIWDAIRKAIQGYRPNSKNTVAIDKDMALLSAYFCGDSTFRELAQEYNVTCQAMQQKVSHILKRLRTSYAIQNIARSYGIPT